VFFEDLFVHVLLQQRLVRSSPSPVDNQRFPNAEQHDRNLNDREEAPYRCLLHQVGRNQTREVGTGQEEEDSLHDHSFLLIEGKEWREHQEEVNANAGDEIGGFGHWERPREVIGTTESTNFLSTQPFRGRFTSEGLVPGIGQQKTTEQQGSADKAQPLNDHVTIDVFLVLCQGGVDHMTKIGLQTDVQEPKDGQNLVDQGVTDRGVEVRGDEKVLNGLEEFHGKEEENS